MDKATERTAQVVKSIKEEELGVDIFGDITGNQDPD
jgi:hypothetical protein